MPTQGEPGLVGSIARELADCRQRGIERLDFTSHNQGRIDAPELERLAAAYAATRPLPVRGRIAQIKLLLRDALAALEPGNPADARLVRDLFFGADAGTVRQLPTQLLRNARRKYGNLSESRFRDIRNLALRGFAEFVAEFVASAAAPSGSGSPGRAEPASAAAPAQADRRLISFPLKAILRFSLVDPGDTSAHTIEEHQRIITDHGRCWWGWFKAVHDSDHTSALAERLRNCEIGLWERAENLFYVAQCDEVVVGGGELIDSPQKELTPPYYRPQPYPAWLSLRNIRDSSHQEFAERFGDLPTERATIYWNSEPTPEPVVVQAEGNAILHLADLQFGRNHRWNTVNTPRRSFISTEHAITQALLVHGIDLAAIGVVVICGNFASEVLDPDAFDEASAFIDGLCEQLQNVQHDDIVIVPGANDFARPEDRERAHQTLYRKFHLSLHGDEEITRMRRYEFDTFRLNVLPVNSVKMLGLDERDEGQFGYGYDPQFNAMREDYLRNHEHTVVVNAVAVHHHLISTPVKWPKTVPQEPVRARVMPGIHDARDVLTKLSNSHVALYLHGHLHEADCYTVMSDSGWRTAICGAGSTGASEGWLRSRYLDNHHNSLGLYHVSDGRIEGRMLTFDENFRRDPPVRRFQIQYQPS